jgi:oligopeptide transport system substrate-binding protein
MNRKRFTRLAMALMMVTAIIVSSVSFAGAQDPKVLRGAFLPGDVTLDPALATDANSILILNHTYVGLTGLHEETGEIEAGIASDWTVSEDGMTYTFNLIPEISWVDYNEETGEVEQVMDADGNPRYVTAQDFVYGWQRTLDPNTAGDYASVLAPWVVGGSELLSADPASDLTELKNNLGIRAVDDYTLEIQTPITASFVPMIYGLWMARPQPQWVVEEFGDAWTNAENNVSYGPYALAAWDADVELLLVKNPFWAGTATIPVPTIDELSFIWLDQSAQLAAYEAGELDVMEGTIPSSELDRLRVERPDELWEGPSPFTYYYGFNVEKAPMDNVHMRRALSFAIDREAIVTILNGGQRVAGFFTNPDLAGSPQVADYPDYGAVSDPELARQELEAYFAETGTTLEDLPPITLGFNTSELHATIAQAIQQMWVETLGIEVQTTSQEFDVYLETLDNDAYQVYRLAWGYDYPDPNSFLYDVFHSTAGNNDTNWSDPEFDRLVEEARLLSDPAERAEMYAQAENLLVREGAAIAPIYHYSSIEIAQPYVTRTYSVLGQERFEKWDVNR